MYVVFYSIKEKSNRLIDHYEVFEEYNDANSRYEDIRVLMTDIYSAGLANIQRATEGHWVEEA